MTTLSRRTALIGSTSALAGSLVFSGAMFARQESTPDPDDTLDELDDSHLLDAAAEAIRIVEADRAAVPAPNDADQIDALIQDGTTRIETARDGEHPRRDAIAGVALLAAGQALLGIPSGPNLPSRAGITSLLLADTGEAIQQAATDSEADPATITRSQDLHAAAVNSYDEGNFSASARQVQAAALVLASGRLLALTGDDVDHSRLQRGFEGRRERRAQRALDHHHRRALAAPMIALLRPVTPVDIPPATAG